jgi:hypothetical protein
MASLYRKKGSQYFWIEFRNATGERCQQSTKLRFDNPYETREARKLRDDLSRREREATPGRPEMWHTWVGRFLSQRYSETPLTYKRAIEAWRNIAGFLDIRGIIVPRQLSRQLVRDFVSWRENPVGQYGSGRINLAVRAGSRNTAILEVAFWSAIMQEAV